ncbi:MAG: ATP-binding cassette domain-containing protein [Cellulosilyticaceae bacterium]
MLKSLRRAIPILIVSLTIAAILAFMEAKMMIIMFALTDTVISGDYIAFKQNVPTLLIVAMSIVPISLLHCYTYAMYKKKANVNIKNYYLKGVFNKNISEFHEENNALYVSGLTNDCNQIDTNLVESFYEVCRSGASFCAGIWMIVSATPNMLVLVMGVVVINILFSKVISKPVAKHMEERSGLFEGYTAYIKEVLAAFHIIKSNNLQQKVQENFDTKSKDVQFKGYRIDKMHTYIMAVQNCSMQSTLYFLLLICAYMAIKGEMTIGGALLVIQGAQMVMWPVMNISERLPKLFTVQGLISKMEKTLINTDTHEEVLNFDKLEESIVFKDVEFEYNNDVKVLEKTNLTLQKGGKYLVVGPSGGGKSTFLKLLRKYFNPTKGEILMDGKLLKDIKKEDFYSNVANVEQQVFIFEDTLKNNLTMYKKYTDKQLNRAIERAGLTTFVEQLPEGLETMIVDNGSNISGGERSRIVIARGLLSEASILFLDEAFAALDMERAKEIEESILALKDITIINVSHVVFEENRHKYDAVLNVKNHKISVSTAS